MTWQQAKLFTLQKMFSAPGGTILSDETTADYIAAMPAAANEALLMLATAFKPIVKSITVQKQPGRQQMFDLKQLAADLFSLSGCCVWKNENGTLLPAFDWQIAGERYLLLSAKAEGEYTLYYNAYPPLIDADTPDDFTLPAQPEAAALVPLYMASQLYRDDDAQTATICRNEFETGLSRLSRGLGDEGMEQFISESGWC